MILKKTTHKTNKDWDYYYLYGNPSFVRHLAVLATQMELQY